MARVYSGVRYPNNNEVLGIIELLENVNRNGVESHARIRFHLRNNRFRDIATYA